MNALKLSWPRWLMAAALLMLVMRTGLLSGVEHTRAVGQQLASAHWDRHIDPDGEWMGPRDWA